MNNESKQLNIFKNLVLTLYDHAKRERSCMMAFDVTGWNVHKKISEDVTKELVFLYKSAVEQNKSVNI